MTWCLRLFKVRRNALISDSSASADDIPKLGRHSRNDTIRDHAWIVGMIRPLVLDLCPESSTPQA